VLVVRYGEIVGEGCREFGFNVYGSDTGFRNVLHAERVALHYAGELAAGSTLYATVEPCIELDDSNGIVPCSRLIADAGVARVVIGILDPNPAINGRGAEYLRSSGIEVCTIGGFEGMIQPLIDVDPRKRWRHARRDWRQSVTHTGKNARASARILREMREATLSDEMTNEMRDDMMGEYPA